MPGMRIQKNNQLYDPKYLLKTSRKSEILQRLGEMHIGLSSLSQEPSERPKHLNAVAAELISARFLGSTDKELRLLSCTCVVDILRVYAPEAPYSDAELCLIFKAITRELKGLGTCNMESTQGTRIFYILQSLSIVKSCVVLVYMSLQLSEGATEVLVDFFDVLVSSIRQDHPEEVGGHIGAILQECIEESGSELNPDALCILLSGLLPVARKENPATYRLCQSVLRRVVNCIQAPVGGIVNKILVGASADIDEIEGYDLGEHVYALVYELHKISPGLLLRILPNLCTQLQAEELDIRMKAVKLLGNLFSSPHAEYGVEFSRNFRDFLGRFVDVSAAVREEMVEAGSLIMKAKPELRKIIEEHMTKRLRDSEWEIRQAVLLRLTEVATVEPDSLSKDSYSEMAERMKDRRPSIRRSAMLCLARLYCRHVSGQFADVAETYAAGENCKGGKIKFGTTAETWSLFNRIPGYIISCWGYPEFVDKQLVVQLLQEYIIPRFSYSITRSVPSAEKCFDDLLSSPSRVIGCTTGGENTTTEARTGRNEASEGVRATALLAMWSTLDPAGRAGLASILGFKTKVRKALTEFLQARSGAPRGMALRKSTLHVLTVLAPQDKKQLTSDSLISSNDNTVYRLLGQALESPCSSDATRASSTNSSFHSNCAYRDDLRERVKSKSALGEYMSCLYETAAFMVASRDTVQSLLRAGMAVAGDGDDAAVVLNLLSMLAKYCPQSFEGFEADIVTWLRVTVEADTVSRKAKKPTRVRSSGVVVEHTDLADKASTLSLVSIVKLSAAFLWPLPQLGCSNGSDTCELCDALLSWSRHCSDPEVCFALSEAACALINVSPSGEKPTSTISSGRWAKYVPRAIKDMSSPTALRSTPLRLACNFNALAPLCIIGSRETIFAEGEVSSFLSENFLSSPAEEGHRGSKGLTDVSVLEGAIRAWAACASIVESTGSGGDTSNTTTSSQSLTLGSTSRVMSALFSSLEKRGAVFGRFQVAKIPLRDRLREACARALVELIKVKSVARSLSVVQWQTLSWTLLDSSKHCRRKALGALCLVIQTHNVHPRFLALPCLVASDDENKVLAQQAFDFSVKRLRLSHDVVCSKVMMLEDQEKDEEAERMRRVAEGIMPECILPYAIHLLSYHPDFPVSVSLSEEGDSKRVGHIVNSLRMVINTILGNGGGDTNNTLSYLLKQVEILGTYYCDKLNNGNEGLALVANLAREILDEKCRLVDNLQPYPGEITLPMDLYRRRRRGESPTEAKTPPSVSGTPISGMRNIALLHSSGKHPGSSQRENQKRESDVENSSARPSKRRRRLDSGKENEGGTRGRATVTEKPQRASARIRDGSSRPAPFYEDNSASDVEVEMWEEAAALRSASKSSVLSPTNENVGRTTVRPRSAVDKHYRSAPALEGKKPSRRSTPETNGGTRSRRSLRGKVSKSSGECIKQYFASSKSVR